MSSVAISAISSTYVGSGITRRSSSDLTASGATITVPAGYYKSQGTKSVTTGTAGTPSASKGTVSNHSISITPSVTNTTGYISGGTKTGTAVSVAASELVSGTKSITANGTGIDVTNYAAVDVAVPGDTPVIDSLTVTPSTSEQTFNSSSVDGYKPVVVEAMPIGSASMPVSISATNAQVTTNGPGTAIGLSKTISLSPEVVAGYISAGDTTDVAVSLSANVPVNNSDDLEVSGATVTAPAGYYVNPASKSVTTMTLPTSAAASATSGYTSKATISRSTSAQYINIPPGYNSAGGYYTISATPNGSVTAPSSISGTSATVSTGTNTLTLTKSVSVTPSVTTAGYISSGTAGNSSVSLTASVTTKAAATITPTTTNQTIASGTYLTGTQTIAGDADLIGSNIISTANIFNVQGTVVINKYYTGSSAPSSSLGNNGDIYLQS